MDRTTTKYLEEQASSNETSSDNQAPTGTTGRAIPLAFKDPLLGTYKVGSRFQKESPLEEGHIVIQLSIPTGQTVTSVATPTQTAVLVKLTNCSEKSCSRPNFQKHSAQHIPPINSAAQINDTLETSASPQKMDFAAVAEWLATNDIMEPYVGPASDAHLFARVEKQRKRTSYSTMAAWNAFRGISGLNELADPESDDLDTSDIRPPYHPTKF